MAVLHPPAKCRSCGEIVPALDFAFENARNIALAGNVVGPCPNCGGPACDVLDGVYDFTSDVVTILSAPDATKDALIAAGLLFERAKAAGKSNEEALGEAARALPALEKVKGLARSVAGKVLIALFTLAVENRANHLIDSLFDSSDGSVNVAQVEVIAKRILAEEAGRAAAARAAGITEQQDGLQPALKMTPQLAPSTPRFPNSMEKLQRDLAQRYRYQKMNWPPKGQ